MRSISVNHYQHQYEHEHDHLWHDDDNDTKEGGITGVRRSSRIRKPVIKPTTATTTGSGNSTNDANPDSKSSSKEDAKAKKQAALMATSEEFYEIKQIRDTAVDQGFKWYRVEWQVCNESTTTIMCMPHTRDVVMFAVVVVMTHDYRVIQRSVIGHVSVAIILLRTVVCA